MIQIVLTYYIAGIVLMLLGGAYIGIYGAKNDIPGDILYQFIATSARVVTLGGVFEKENALIKMGIQIIELMLLPFLVHWTIWYVIKAVDHYTYEKNEASD